MAHMTFRELREERRRKDPEGHARANEAIVEARAAYALAQLRRARKITQQDLAEALGLSQANISAIERRDDLLISTLRRVVEGLGGRLVLTARIDDEEFELAL